MKSFLPLTLYELMSFVTGMSYSMFRYLGSNHHITDVYPLLDDKRDKRGRTGGGKEEERKKWKEEIPRLVLDSDHDFFSH